METKPQNLNHKCTDIQDSHTNGFNCGINTLSNHQSNGLKNAKSCHSDIRDVQDSQSDATLSCTPLQITEVLAGSAMSPGMIKKYAFLFDDKIPSDNLGDLKTDRSSGVAPGVAPSVAPGVTLNQSPSSAKSGLSPASLSNGNPSVCFSMDESVFTYEDTQNDLDSGGTTEHNTTKDVSDTSDGQKTSSDIEHSSPVSCDDNTKYVDKSMLIKSVIEKVYVHTITYTVEDLLRFQKLKAEFELSQNIQSTPNSEKTPNTPSPAIQKEFVHKKFSGGSIKNFLKSMTPKSRHRTLSKSSESFGSRSSSNLGDSADGASVSDEPLESADSAQKTHLARHPERKSPVFSGVSSSPRNKTKILNNLTVDYLKSKTVDSPATCH